MGILVYLFVSLCVVNVVADVGVREFAESDAFIQSLLSSSLGKSNSAYKVLSRIQNGAFELLSTLTRPLTTAKRQQFLRMLNAAAKAKNTEKVHELLGKILFTMQKTENSTELEKISSTYAPLLISGARGEGGASREEPHPFDLIYDHLYVLDGFSTLVFAMDTTGSMHEDIQEAKDIVFDIIDLPRLNEVDYILSPFNDPATGPVIARPFVQRAQFITDVSNLNANGGGDCPELAFTGMENALNNFPRYGSSMFVFTDAAPKDGDAFNVQNVIDVATLWYGMKISFFLDEHVCGSETEIDKFRKVAAETGGEVFLLEPIDKKRKRRRRSTTTRSQYSAFVSSSLSGTSLITSGTSGASTGTSGSRGPTGPTEKGFEILLPKVVGPTVGVTNTHNFDIDEAISYVNVVVTFETSATTVSLSDPTPNSKSPSSTGPNAVIYEIENPATGTWKLSVEGNSESYNFKVSVAFKEPITFDVRYFYEERPKKFFMVQRPLIGVSQQLMINVVGGDKIDSSSIKAFLVDLEGNQISTLTLTNIGSKDSLKFSAPFTPSNKPFRVRLTGKTNKGLNFERTTEQATNPAQIIFKTVFAGDEFSVNIGGDSVRIMNVLIIKKELTKNITMTATAQHGKVTPAEQTKQVRAQGFFFLQYEPPTDASLTGRSDYITVQASYTSGEVTTHRISILLL